MSWNYRVHKCHCGRAAVTSDEQGQPLCAAHAPRPGNSAAWEAQAKTALLALYDRVGQATYEAWVDRNVADTDTWEMVVGKLQTAAVEQSYG